MDFVIIKTCKVRAEIDITKIDVNHQLGAVLIRNIRRKTLQ